MKFISTCTLIVLSMATVHAQIYVKQDATGTNDGSSWANAFTNLQDGLKVLSEGQQIWIASGTYIPDGPSPEKRNFMVKVNAEIYGGFAGTENNLNERDLVNQTTILSGDVNKDDIPNNFNTRREDNAYHIMILETGAGETIVDGLVFKNGGQIESYGGGLYIKRSNATIRNCTFRENNAKFGGGVYAVGDAPNSSSLKIENSTFDFNNAISGGAGAYVQHWTNFVIDHSTFENNASGYAGGGLNAGNSNVYINGCVFNQNFSKSGGGCMLFHNMHGRIDKPFFQINKSTFSGNQGLEDAALGDEGSASGGALRVTNLVLGFDLVIDSCVFKGNSNLNTWGSGGAIAIDDLWDIYSDEPTNSIKIVNSEISSNTAANGSGVALVASDDTLRIEFSNNLVANNAGLNGGGLYIGASGWNAILESTFKHNQFIQNVATDFGGGIMFDRYETQLRPIHTIDSCTFIGNVATAYGGAIYSSSFCWGQEPGCGMSGLMQNSLFENNKGFAGGGAIFSYQDIILIENCFFNSNSTVGTYTGDIFFDPNKNAYGGGAIMLHYSEEVIMRNSIFKNNISDQEGSAVYLYKGSYARLENILFAKNTGGAALVNHGSSLRLMNATLVDNDYGIYAGESSYSEIQNSIFRNSFQNFYSTGDIEFISNGGNISDDESMTRTLMGSGIYNDLNNTDPKLDNDYIPSPGSPAIDAGNQNGIQSTLDLAGNPRIQGATIDIGCYESFLVAVKEATWDHHFLKVFPNPVNETLNLTFESNVIGNMDLSIYNYIGQRVHRATLNKSNKIQLFRENINVLPQGEYVVVVKNGQDTYATNILIQR